MNTRRFLLGAGALGIAGLLSGGSPVVAGPTSTVQLAGYRTMPPPDPKPDDPKRPKRSPATAERPAHAQPGSVA